MPTANGGKTTIHHGGRFVKGPTHNGIHGPLTIIDHFKKRDSLNGSTVLELYIILKSIMKSIGQFHYRTAENGLKSV